MIDTQNWVAWAFLSACFAALTAVFAKVGLARVDPDYATLVRTAVILVVVAGMVGAMGKWQDPRALPPRSLLFPERLLVAIFAMVFLGERPSPRDWLGIVLVAAGALTLALKR